MNNKVYTRLSAAFAALILAASAGCGTPGTKAQSGAASDTGLSSSESASSWYFIDTPDAVNGAGSRKENEKIASDGTLGALDADWAKNTEVSSYTEYKADDTEFCADVMLTANEDVKDLRVISVSFTVSEYDDEPYYVVEDKLECGDLAKGQSVKISMSFPGDLPTNGIAFTDYSGRERFYVLSESGKDGSLINFEIK